MTPSLALALLLLQAPAAAPDLYATATKLDAALSDAYNRCELPQFQALLDPGVEFYHDKGGLTQGAAALTETVKKNICGRVRRTLVPASMKVYPMDGTGLLQTGVHRFCEIQPDGSCPVGGEAQFIHLWKREGSVWRLLRAVSFDHQPYPAPAR